nr:hypothetical protein [Tanacetum cinerariifolium]
DVVPRGQVRDEGASESRGGATGSKGRGSVAMSKGGASGSRSGVSVSRGVVCGSKGGLSVSGGASGQEVKMDDPNITMEEYIRLEEEKVRRRGQVYNWETATYGKFWCNEDVHDLRSIESEFPAIVLNDALTSEVAVSCEPTDSENDNNKVNMPSFLSPDNTVSYFDDLDFFKDFENEFPAIVYSDALTSKLDLLTKPSVSPQHIYKFDLKDETSLSECDENGQNVLCFNDLFHFNVIYPNDSKSDKDNDDDKINIKHSLGDCLRRIQTPWIRRIDLLDVIQSLFFSTADTAYSLNEYSVYDTGINSVYPGRNSLNRKSKNVGEGFTNLEIMKCLSLETSRLLFNTQSCSINQHGESTKQI